MAVYAASFVLPLAFSLLLTPLLIFLAKRIGHLAYPSPRGWHQKPTPLLGGFVLFLSFLAGLYYFNPHSVKFHLFTTGAILFFLLGLADDFFHFKPLIKFLGQAVIIWIALPDSPPALLLFVLLIVNSFNLLDNIDGLAGGIAGITAMGLACWGILSQQKELTLLALVLAGAAAGFLVYNFHPAKIFMGDGGSLFLGFVLSALPSLSLEISASFFPILILLFAVPILDTLFVIYSRFRKKTPITRGGQDHLSHWFLSRGFSPRKSVLILYGITLSANLIGLYLMKNFIRS